MYLWLLTHACEFSMCNTYIRETQNRGKRRETVSMGATISILRFFNKNLRVIQPCGMIELMANRLGFNCEVLEFGISKTKRNLKNRGNFRHG